MPGAGAANEDRVISRHRHVVEKDVGIRRATVLGQLFPGTVSVFRADESAAEVLAIPFVVFAGNVGDDSTLADVIERMRAPLSPG